MDQPWLIIGDFNQVLLPTEKSNANGSTSKMHNIYVCMNRNQFIKVPQKGPCFTSMNNRKGKALIIEKLDMVFCNMLWFDCSPLTHVNNQIISASDHSLIILSTELQQHPRKHHKFEPIWYNFLDCVALINIAWTSEFRRSASYILQCMLQSTLSSLIHWSKSKIGNFKQKIGQLEKTLVRLSDKLDLDSI